MCVKIHSNLVLGEGKTTYTEGRSVDDDDEYSFVCCA